MKWKRNTGFGRIEDRRGQAPSGGGLGGMLGGGSGGGIPIPIPSGKAGGGIGIGTIVVVVVLFLLFSGVLGGSGGMPGVGGLGGGAIEPGGTLEPAERHGPAARLHRRFGRGVLGRRVPPGGQGLPRDQARPLRAVDAVVLRAGVVGDRAVLLPRGPEGLPGSRLPGPAPVALRGAGRRLRDGLRRGARVRPPRPERSSGSRSACRSSPSRTRTRRTTCRCARSCRPTAWRGSGRTRRRPMWSPATSRRPSAPRRPSATTGSRRRRRAAIDPESWTHGSAEQRVQWFTTGYRSGNSDDCDTFAA